MSEDAKRNILPRRLTIDEGWGRWVARDSFVNFAHKMGVGADNALSSATYGFNPITRMRQLLEWIHRGSWLGGIAVDLVAEDMTRGGVTLHSQLDPDELEDVEEYATACGVWQGLKRTLQWGRLYGGSLGVILLEGQTLSSPLREETVGKDQFKGIVALDRWMVEPSLNDLVTDYGPNMGLPKFYEVLADAPTLRGEKIHYSRIIRHVGIDLPYQQSLAENFWGESVLERLYDRMIAYDSATTGAAQLVYKSYLRTMSIQKMREIVAAGGKPLEGLVRYVDMMRRFQNIEGITLIDGEDSFEEGGARTFTGINDALTQFGQQLSGALQIPLVRLFGQSPGGLNSTGESDLRTYYDNVRQRQENGLKVPVTLVYRLIMRSLGMDVTDGLRLSFKSLWQLREEEKAGITEKVTKAVNDTFGEGIIRKTTALKELRALSEITGVFTNISDEEIKEAEEHDQLAQERQLEDLENPPELQKIQQAGELGAAKIEQQGQVIKARRPTQDSAWLQAEMMRLHDLQVTIETFKGQQRAGGTLQADYGYINGTTGEDGDQIDAFFGPHLESKRVWVLDTKNMRTGKFDEHKVMLGYPNMLAAMGDFIGSYHDLDPGRVTGIVEYSMDDFRAWLKNFPYKN